MDDLVKRLRNPPFGTDASERNLMAAAADRIEQDGARIWNEAIEAAASLLTDQDAENVLSLRVERTANEPSPVQTR